MTKITKFFRASWVAIATIGGFLVLIVAYGFRKFREGKAIGEAEGVADAAKERIEEDRQGVRDAKEARDGGELFRRARKWTEKDRK